ncbi:MAG: 50S ribosomal protein L10 [Rhodothermia bacterium]|nr:50S ribosomal protein L10 [Rhodothermia bacterium]
MLDSSPIVYLTNFSGLSVAQATDLRNRFRDMGVQYRVVKNTLLKIAMEKKGGFENLYEHLNGPVAVAFSEDPSAPARVIKKFLTDEKSERPELRAAFIEGAIYQADALETLAALKSKDELIADIVGLLMAPMTNIVGALQGAGSNLVGSIRAIAEKEA